MSVGVWATMLDAIVNLIAMMATSTALITAMRHRML